MGKYYELTPGQAESWAHWVETRPKVLQDVCKKIKPNVVYKLGEANRLVILHSFNINRVTQIVTCVLIVPQELQQDKFVLNTYVVNGVDPDDLTEADLPKDTLFEASDCDDYFRPTRWNK